MVPDFKNLGDGVVAWMTDKGIRPNHLTMLGLALVTANCLAYPWHRNSLWLGVGLLVSVSFDVLDGALARRQHSVSKFGGYLDAVVDRYQEIIIFLTLAWVNSWWPACFVAITGSMLTSYNKARVAIEIPIDNKNWPDLLDRPRRLALLLFGLLLDSFVPVPAAIGGSLLFLVIWVLAILTHVTAIQRFWRARRLLVAVAKDDQTPPASAADGDDRQPVLLGRVPPR